MPYKEFKAIKAAVSIEDAANPLKLSVKKSGNQSRSNCPACGNEDERIVVMRDRLPPARDTCVFAAHTQANGPLSAR
jgi:hypothetical protein